MKVAAFAIRHVCLVAAIALAACGAGPDREVIARELHGSWVSDAPQYAERGFDITDDFVTLHQGDGIRATFAIEKITRREHGSYIDYVITYRDGHSSVEFPLEYRAGDGEPDLRFPNQQRVVWTRAPSSGG